MRILVRSPVHLTLSVLLLHCNTSRSRPPVRLPSLTFQADCSSIKGAGLSAEEGTEHYLPWWSGEYIRDKFNHCQHRNTKSRRQQLSQLLFRWSRVCPSLPLLWIRHCWGKGKKVKADIHVALHGNPAELRDVTCHGIAQCYLPPDTSERAPP